jgi:hypothetical protein
MEVLNAYLQAASGGTPYTRWRAFFTDNWGSASFVELADVEFHPTVGGADITSGGTPSVSSTSGLSAANLFDNNAATSMIFASGQVTNQWAAYQLGSASDVQEIVIVPADNTNGLDRCPKTIKLQYSSDGTNWFDHSTIVGQILTCPVRGAPRKFPEPALAAGYHRAWRLFVNTVNGAAFTEIREIEFRATSGGADQTAAVGANGSSSGRGIQSGAVQAGAYACFDNGVTDWRASGGTNQWVGFVFPQQAGVKVEEIVLQAGSNVTQAPSTFALQYSDDGLNGTTWTTQKTFGPMSWTAGQSRTLAAI